VLVLYHSALQYFTPFDPRFYLSNPENGQIIVFDVAQNKWTNVGPESVLPNFDPNSMVFTDADGNLTSDSNFSYDGTTGIISETVGFGGLDMRFVKSVKFSQTTKRGQPIHLEEQGNSGILLGLLCDNSDPDKMPAIGLAMEDYANNTDGYVVRNGRLVEIVNDASVFDIVLATGSSLVGRIVYVNGLGKLTLTRPNGASELVQNMGQITKINGSGIDILIQGAGRTNDVPNTISIPGDITCDTLHYNSLDPQINIPSVFDSTITVSSGTYTTVSGGTFTLNQDAGPQNIIIDVDRASLSIPDPALNTAITLTPGTHMTGGGSFSLNQSSVESITLNVDRASLSIPDPANDSTVTIASQSPWLTGGGNFSTNQLTGSTINLSLDTSSAPAPDTLVVRDSNGDISCETLHYTSLSPPISGSALNTTITLAPGTHMSGGGSFSLNQSSPQTITLNVDKSSLSIPDPANDSTINIASQSPWLTGGGNFSTNQLTNSTINLSLDTSSAPAPDTLVVRDSNGDISCETLNYTSLSPAISVPTVNNTAITLNPGNFLTGGGIINLNQSSVETITFDVDSVSLKNSIGAYDSQITLGVSGGGLTGGGFFTVDAQDNKTINFGTNGTPDATPSTLVLRDASGNFSVNELSYSSLNPPISGGGDLTIDDVDNIPVPEVPMWSIQSPKTVSYDSFLVVSTNLIGACYGNSGTKLYTVEANTLLVKEYNLSPAYDITTATVVNQITTASGLSGIDFDPSGNYFAVIRNITSDALVLYECVSGSLEHFGSSPKTVLHHQQYERSYPKPTLYKLVWK
jgi:hypothetical protein